MPSAVERFRGIAVGLPGVTEKLSHGAPAFFAGKQFAQVWPDGHHEHGFPHAWLAAPPGTQEALLAQTSGRFFRPPYVGHRGWIGLRLDEDVDWVEVDELVRDAYRTVAPARRVKALDARGR